MSSPALYFDLPPRPLDGYHMQFFSGGTHNPADSTTYHIGALPVAPYVGAAAPYAVYIPRSGSVRYAVFQAYVSGTLGSAEQGSVYIRVNNTDDYLLSAALEWDVGRNGIGGDFDPGVIPLIKDDFIEFIVVTPAWVTNPTGVLYWAQLWIEP